MHASFSTETVKNTFRRIGILFPNNEGNATIHLQSTYVSSTNPNFIQNSAIFAEKIDLKLY